MSWHFGALLWNESGRKQRGHAHPKAGSDMRPAMLGSSCFESGKTKRERERVLEQGSREDVEKEKGKKKYLI